MNNNSNDDMDMNNNNDNNMDGGRRRRNMTRKNRNGRNNMMGGAMKTVGSKASVFHGNALKTSGGLTKKDLMKNKHGRIVSRKKHSLGKKALKNLIRAGYKAKRGSFKLFKK